MNDATRNGTEARSMRPRKRPSSDQQRRHRAPLLAATRRMTDSVGLGDGFDAGQRAGTEKVRHLPVDRESVRLPTGSKTGLCGCWEPARMRRSNRAGKIGHRSNNQKTNDLNPTSPGTERLRQTCDRQNRNSDRDKAPGRDPGDDRSGPERRSGRHQQTPNSREGLQSAPRIPSSAPTRSGATASAVAALLLGGSVSNRPCRSGRGHGIGRRRQRRVVGADNSNQGRPTLAQGSWTCVPASHTGTPMGQTLFCIAFFPLSNPTGQGGLGSWTPPVRRQPARLAKLSQNHRSRGKGATGPVARR